MVKKADLIRIHGSEKAVSAHFRKLAEIRNEKLKAELGEEKLKELRREWQKKSRVNATYNSVFKDKEYARKMSAKGHQARWGKKNDSNPAAK